MKRLIEAHPYYLTSAIDGSCSAAILAEGSPERELIERFDEDGKLHLSLHDGEVFLSALQQIPLQKWVEQVNASLAFAEDGAECVDRTRGLYSAAASAFPMGTWIASAPSSRTSIPGLSGPMRCLRTSCWRSLGSPTLQRNSPQRFRSGLARSF